IMGVNAMRIPAYILVLFLIATFAHGQEQTLVRGDVERSGFGGPVIKYTRIHDQNAFLVGGRGGWFFNHSLMLGGGGYGVISEVDAPSGALGPWEKSPLDIEFGYLGLEIEYLRNSGSLLHYNFYTLLGGGADNYVKDAGSVWDSNEQSGETDFMLVMEPAITGELNVTPWFRLNAGISWRLVSGVEQAGLDNSDFSGPSAALTLKFGRF
ncbi:MAG: hypothetical protein ACYC9O_18550, partial [Candidatus Latescibacterota bacterium]